MGSGWATCDALPDPGTAGTSLAYSVRSGGVILSTGRPLLIDALPARPPAGASAVGS